jgi:hypothetical protein
MFRLKAAVTVSYTVTQTAMLLLLGCMGVNIQYEDCMAIA